MLEEDFFGDYYYNFGRKQGFCEGVLSARVSLILDLEREMESRRDMEARERLRKVAEIVICGEEYYHDIIHFRKKYPNASEERLLKYIIAETEYAHWSERMKNERS